LWLIVTGASLAIRLIGPTLRYSISWEEGSAGAVGPRPVIYAFWHRCVLPAVYLFRDFNIRVMTSRSYDGECIARILLKFGFVPVRGSSSRGAVPALLGMRRAAEAGWTVAFTIDGPRGPKYVAKPGPVLLSKVTGVPMATFYAAVEDPWILNTWDQFMIPKPFSRVLVRLSHMVTVPPEADAAQMEDFHQGLQASLEQVTKFAEANVRKVGSEEFPVLRRG
jgi:lysophospholipid acyltransferase (LPLAT)-like uncharacterized protein